MKKITLSCLFIFTTFFSFSQTIAISGTVADDKGNPIPFVFIKDAQHNYATFSGPNGEFEINADPSSELMATANNYKKAVIKIDNQNTLKIIMAGGDVTATSTGKSTDAFEMQEIGGPNRDARPLAVFGTAKEELHGSPYFFDSWVHGYAISNTDTIRQNDSYLFNYQKMDGALLYTGDGKTMSTVDKTQIKQFILFDDNGKKFVFENVPEIDPKHYVQVISAGSKYKIYRDLNTTFLKSDFQTNGITSSGNNYDSYVDESTYYVVKLPNGTPQKFTLKKKAIKTAFGADADKVNKFFSDNDADELDDAYLQKLGDYMNN